MRNSIRRNLLAIFLLLGVAVALAALGSLGLIQRAAAGRVYSNPTEIPHRHVGLVLGCSRRLGTGRLNPFFDSRIRAATELFRAGKVDYFLVSGDNHIRGYDEATDMRNGLLEEGVPAGRIYSDCAGFRTLDSIARARDVFGLQEITVISQEFHNERALFLAAHQGVDAIGYNAPDVDLDDFSGAHKRDKLAKIKAFMDVYLLRTRPRFLGSRIIIGMDPPTTCSAAQ